VCAPGKIPRAAGDRVKTDRRDAEHLVRLLLAGRLHAVQVPGPAEEALRDLVRAREDVRVDLMRARHRSSGWCPARSPPASAAGWARSPRPAPATPAGCWSRRPGITATHRAWGASWPTARPVSPRGRWRSAGARSSACIAPGGGAERRGKRRSLIAVAVAVARELAGFCWSIAHTE
jgi:Transposase